MMMLAKAAIVLIALLLGGTVLWVTCTLAADGDKPAPPNSDVAAAPSTAPTPVAPAAQSGDAEAFARLTQPERFSALIAALQAREAALQNVHYQLKAGEYRHPAGAAEIHSATMTYDIRHLEDRLLISAKGTHLDMPRDKFPLGTLDEQYVDLWDGSIFQSLSKRSGRWAAGVSDSMASGLSNLSYEQVLGYNPTHNQIATRHAHLSQLLETLAEAASDQPREQGGFQRTIHVELDGEKSASAIILQITEASATGRQVLSEKYHFDVVKGYMLRMRERRGGMGEAFNQTWIEVTDQKLVNGLWVPTIVDSRQATSATPATSRQHYEIVLFEIGVVKPEDMQIEFPPGTTVIDSVKGRGYRVLPDGTKKDVPYFDTATGRIVRPATQPATQSAVAPE